MLGWIGRWAQSKGMKLLPNWLGVDKTTAQTAVVTEGFTLGTVTQSDSTVAAEAANHNKIISQSPASGTAQDYETTVNLTWRNFSFTPFSFSPVVFGFSPFGFSPVVFGFSPITTVFAFSPVVFGFSPIAAVFGFSPVVFSFSPTPRCIDEDTPIATYNEDSVIIYKKAKDIVVGDIVWGAIWDEFIDESFGSPTDNPSLTLSNLEMQTTEIMAIQPSVKSTTLYINGDIEKRFSLEENMLIKRDGFYMFRSTGTIVVGDIFLHKTADDSIEEVEITSIDYVDEDRTVYRFDAEPLDNLFAGDILVHNGKTFF